MNPNNPGEKSFLIHCSFGSVTVGAAGHNVFWNIAFGIINPINSVVNIMSITGFSAKNRVWCCAAVIAVGFCQILKLISRNSKHMATAFCSGGIKLVKTVEAGIARSMSSKFYYGISQCFSLQTAAALSNSTNHVVVNYAFDSAAVTFPERCFGSKSIIGRELDKRESVIFRHILFTIAVANSNVFYQLNSQKSLS